MATHSKVDEILDKFNNKGLYQNSAIFHNMVNYLANGVSEYEIILKLIDMLENQTQAFQNFMLRDTRPIQLPNGDIYKVNYD